MGKLEKLVVLTVLFLVAVILGVSLNSDEGAVDPQESPLSVARAEAPAEEAPVQEPRKPRRDPESRSTLRSPGKQPLGPAGALSMEVETEAPPAATPSAQVEPEAVVPAPAEAPTEPEAYVKTLVGLEPSLTEDLMIYTWRQGDSFEQLALTYYGSGSKVHRLRKANEALDERDAVVGQRIWIPVLPGAGVEPAGTEAAWSGGSTYTVRTGDVLGKISQTVYGTSQSWRKIYDANRDQLADPNHLEVGMVLRIPE